MRACFFLFMVDVLVNYGRVWWIKGRIYNKDNLHNLYWILTRSLYELLYKQKIMYSVLGDINKTACWKWDLYVGLNPRSICLYASINLPVIFLIHPYSVFSLNHSRHRKTGVCHRGKEVDWPDSIIHFSQARNAYAAVLLRIWELCEQCVCVWERVRVHVCVLVLKTGILVITGALLSVWYRGVMI